MDIFTEDNEYLLAVSIPLTVLVLIVSVAYSMRNISRIWTAGKPVPVDAISDEDATTSEEEDESATQQSEMKMGSDESNKDPLQYCEHIQSEVKKARHRVATKEIRQNLTAEDMVKERDIQQQQIEDIFKLMEENSDKFGTSSEDDVRRQMKLYV